MKLYSKNIPEFSCKGRYTLYNESMTGKTKAKGMKMKTEVMFEILVCTSRGDWSFGFVTAETWMDAMPMVEKMWNNTYNGKFPFNREDIRLEFVRYFSKVGA